MTKTLPNIREWRNVDAATFRDEILPLSQPAVLKGLVQNWPAVQSGLQSDAALCDYLGGFDAGKPVETLFGPPAIKGRFFYSEDLQGLNFERRAQRLDETLAQLLAARGTAEPPALFIQSASLPDHLPDFGRDNALDIAGAGAVPRIWIGNRVSVTTHYDLSDNIACVVAGQRRFTLFPPDQIENLYVGPIHFTLAGQPVSMVPLDAPDLERYPRFAKALEAAQTAELEPGDALYIPYFWWHHVQSLADFNVLVNYWWNAAQDFGGLPYDCLLHGFLTLRHLPANQRAAWRAMFDHYVFQTGADPVAHLPPENRGALAPMTPDLAAQIKAGLLRRLSRK